MKNCRGVEPRRGASRRNLGTRVGHNHRTSLAYKSGAIAALSKKSPPTRNKKLPPRAPAPNKANQIFALQGRVLLGEVLGERGRFGGRGAPLSRGAPLPPRSFPSPSEVFPSLPLHHLASRAGGESVEKKRAAGGETNAQTRVTAFPNPPRHPTDRRRA